MNSQEKIYFELSDYIRVKRIIEKFTSNTNLTKPHFIQFLSILNNAEILPDGELSESIVKINSYIKYRYQGEKKLHKGKLVFPADINSDPDGLSILTPLGLALIGKKMNTTSEYNAPGGIYRIKIIEVMHEEQYLKV